MQWIYNLTLSGLLACSVGAIQASAVTTFNGDVQKAEHEYNFEKINEALELVAQPLLQADEELVSLSVRFDPEQTDISEDQYKMDAAVTVKETLWSDRPTSIDSSILLNVEPAQPGQPAVLNMDTLIHMQTDTLALLQHVAKMSHEAACKDLGQEKGLDRIFQVEGCSALEVMKRASTLNQMQSAMIGYKEATLVRLQEFVEDARPIVMAAENQLLLEEGQKLLQKTEKLIDILSKTTFKNEGQGFVISVPEMTKESLFTLQDFELKLTPKTLTLDSDIAVQDHLGLYRAMKPEFERILQGLENNETAAIEQMRMLLRMDIAFLEQLLTEQ